MSAREINAFWRRHSLGSPRWMSHSESVHWAYELAEIVEEGDALPHHQGNLAFYHAIKSALRRRGVDASFFGMVIEWKGRSAHVLLVPNARSSDHTNERGSS